MAVTLIASADDIAQVNLRLALSYARGGRDLFPCSANKRLLTKHGVKDASRSPAKIKIWASRWPHCEWGWALPETIVVVDVDGGAGYRSFRLLAGCHPHEFATPIATTVRGGKHLYFATGDGRYKNTAGAAGRHYGPFSVRRGRRKRAACPLYL